MTKRCAIINPKTGVVMNVIITEPHDFPVGGIAPMEIPEGLPVDMRWKWSARGGFQPGDELKETMAAYRYEWRDEAKAFEPNAELKTELDAEVAEAEKRRAELDLDEKAR